MERVLHHWGAMLHRWPWVAAGIVAVTLGVLAAPVLSLRTGMPSITIIPSDQSARAGYVQVTKAFGAGAPGMLQVVTPKTELAAATKALGADKGIAVAMPAGTSGNWAMLLAMPTTDASSRTTGAIDRIRTELPASSLVGGAAGGVVVAAFVTFALSGPLAPKETGVILAVAVFLDALCIRMIILPVVLRLTGHAAWHGPRWLRASCPTSSSPTDTKESPHVRLRHRHHPRHHPRHRLRRRGPATRSPRRASAS